MNYSHTWVFIKFKQGTLILLEEWPNIKQAYHNFIMRNVALPKFFMVILLSALKYPIMGMDVVTQKVVK